MSLTYEQLALCCESRYVYYHYVMHLSLVADTVIMYSVWKRETRVRLTNVL